MSLKNEKIKNYFKGLMNQHHLIVRFTSCTHHPVILNRFKSIFFDKNSSVSFAVVVNYHAWAACGNESF